MARGGWIEKQKVMCPAAHKEPQALLTPHQHNASSGLRLELVQLSAPIHGPWLQPPPVIMYRISRIGKGIPITHSMAHTARLPIDMALLRGCVILLDGDAGSERKVRAAAKRRFYCMAILI
jgi:hypothetical protein